MDVSTDTQTDKDKDLKAGGGSADPVIDPNLEPVVANPDDDNKPKAKNPDLERAIHDMHKYKNLAREREDELKNHKVTKLKEQQKWQELAEQYEREAKEANEKNKSLSDSVAYDRKYNAVKTLALASGLRREALDDLELLDLDDVAIEVTSTGRVNVLNADRAVESIKLSRPHWFGSRKAAINSGDPAVIGSSKVSFADLEKAEVKARKSGDYTTYKKLLIQYRHQLRG